MRLEGRSGPAASTAQESTSVGERITRATVGMCDTLHLPARLVARLRVTSPQPPSFRQRTAAAQERDECLPGLLSNDSPMSANTRSYCPNALLFAAVLTKPATPDAVLATVRHTAGL
jgi:hypothetical protein